MTAGELDKLYRDHGHAVLRRARRLLRDDEDARDVVHDVYLELFRNRGSVRSAQLDRDVPVRGGDPRVPQPAARRQEPHAAARDPHGGRGALDIGRRPSRTRSPSRS